MENAGCDVVFMQNAECYANFMENAELVTHNFTLHFPYSTFSIKARLALG